MLKFKEKPGVKESDSMRYPILSYFCVAIQRKDPGSWGIFENNDLI